MRILLLKGIAVFTVSVFFCVTVGEASVRRVNVNNNTLASSLNDPKITLASIQSKIASNQELHFRDLVALLQEIPFVKKIAKGMDDSSASLAYSIIDLRIDDVEHFVQEYRPFGLKEFEKKINKKGDDDIALLGATWFAINALHLIVQVFFIEGAFLAGLALFVVVFNLTGVLLINRINSVRSTVQKKIEYEREVSGVKLKNLFESDSEGLRKTKEILERVDSEFYSKLTRAMAHIRRGEFAVGSELFNEAIGRSQRRREIVEEFLIDFAWDAAKDGTEGSLQGIYLFIDKFFKNHMAAYYKPSDDGRGKWLGEGTIDKEEVRLGALGETAFWENVDRLLEGKMRRGGRKGKVTELLEDIQMIENIRQHANFGLVIARVYEKEGEWFLQIHFMDSSIQGLDLESIRLRLIERELDKQEEGFEDFNALAEEIDKISDEDLIKRIFDRGFTTKPFEEAQIAGRGLELDDLSIVKQIETKIGAGTHFVLEVEVTWDGFVLPEGREPEIIIERENEPQESRVVQFEFYKSA